MCTNPNVGGGACLPSHIGPVSVRSESVQTLAGHEWWWPASRQRAVPLQPAGCCQPQRPTLSEHRYHPHTLRRENGVRGHVFEYVTKAKGSRALKVLCTEGRPVGKEQAGTSLTVQLQCTGTTNRVTAAFGCGNSGKSGSLSFWASWPPKQKQTRHVIPGTAFSFVDEWSS